jgi:cytidine deaminase
VQANPPRTSAEKGSQNPRSQRCRQVQQQLPQLCLNEPDSQEHPAIGAPASLTCPSLTCRRTGCDERACGTHGFCAECRLAYVRRARARERHLAVLAAAIEREHRALVNQLAPCGAPRALLLAHAAAHQQHNGQRAPIITAAAVRDFLDEAMERLTAERLR